MAKIPFDIKYRDKIESGEYKVETRDGQPVSILAIDIHFHGISHMILAEHNGCYDSWPVNGRYNRTSPDCNLDLFLITPEPELSEFEKRIKDLLAIKCEIFYNESIGGCYDLKGLCGAILSCARKELCESGEVTDWYAKGKAEALKDLPKWRIADRDWDAGTIDFAVFHKNDGGDHEDWLSVEATNRLYEGEYYIELSDLEKLPKEDDK